MDGVAIGRHEEPTSAEQIADLLATAGAGRLGVIPFGGATKLALGNLPARADIGLSLGKLNRILHHEPADLTLSVEAGVRFADLQAEIGKLGQELPIEVPDAAGATIGGLIATALCGPRRLGSGTLRDLLIGIRVAYPSGIVAKAGGLVVKNVSGFDLMRLHHGALGTLGVIVSANFKVLPRPRTEATVCSKPLELREALAIAARVRGSRIRPVALELHPAGAGWQVAIRVMGRESTVALLAGEGGAALGGAARTLDRDESRTFWVDRLRAESLRDCGASALLRASVKPACTGNLLAALANTSAAGGDLEILSASPALGTVLMTASPAAAESAQRWLPELQQALLAVADHVTVLAAPSEAKSGIDVWGREPAALEVTRALKREFDPNAVLNPGRFAGRL